MIAVVWEDVNNCIDSIVEKFNAKFPREARYYLGKKPEISELELLTRPPFTFAGWLIYAGMKTPIKVLQQLEAGRSKNLIIIRVNNEREFREAKDKFSQLQTKFFDNHRLDKESTLLWIQDQLVCSEATAKYLYRYTGGYVRDIVFAVKTLQRDGRTVNNKLIRQLIDKNQSASVFDVTRYLLGIKLDHVHQDDVFQFLFKFQYAESWILETLMKELELYKKVHMLVSERKLTISNYTEVAQLLQDKSIREVPQWKLKRMILDYGDVSLERIVTTQGLLQQVGKSYFDLIYIIQLASIGGY